MAILPNTYQQVEYIESNGTQWIDTGVTATENTKSQIKFMNLEYSGDVIYGLYNSNDNTDYRFFNKYSDNTNIGAAIFDFNSSRILSGTNTILTNVVYELELGNYYVKNIETGTNIVSGTAISSYTSPRTITLNNYNNSTYSKNRWYYVKIYNGSTLQRDFVPCYRKSDGVIGLYDVVNNQFYTNSGTGTFIKGPDKVLKVKAVYIGNYRLPSEYKEVEYIESSGTQYIDTGYTPNINTEITTKMKWGTQSTTWGAFFGVTSDDSCVDGILGRIYDTTSTNFNPRFCNSAYDQCQIGTTLDVWHNVVVKKNYASVDGTTGTLTTTGTPYQANIFIFCGNNGGSAWRFTNFSLAEFQIAESGVLVRDFVPCYRKSDNVIGLYDLVNNVFYTNAGTGTFTKGEDVKPYIKIRPNESGGILSGYWDYTTTSYNDLVNEGWVGAGGGGWSVSSSGLTTSRSSTDRSYMVSLPIQISTKAKSIRIYGVINRTVGSWYGNFSWGIKATNTCGSGRDDYPADDWLINQSINCNTNSGYMGYGAGSSGSVLNCGIPGWNANLGYSGSDLAVEAIIDIENGEVSATWKSGSTTVQSGTSTFDSATVRAALSGVSTNQYLSIFTRNGTSNGKVVKNLGYEIIY